MIKLLNILKELKVEYKDKPYSDGGYTPIETKIKYDNSDIDGIRLKLLTGVASYVDNLMVIYPYISDSESYENRITFSRLGDDKLKELYNKLIDIFSKKEYSYTEAKNLLETVQDHVNPQEESNEATIDDILDKIPSKLLSNKIKKFIEKNFDDLYSYFDDIFDPEKLILKSPKDLADYFDFVYDVMNDERGLDIVEWADYFRNYYNSHMK
jgi:hypothetical protein